MLLLPLLLPPLPGRMSAMVCFLVWGADFDFAVGAARCGGPQNWRWKFPAKWILSSRFPPALK
jgi:hypothetical protein